MKEPRSLRIYLDTNAIGRLLPKSPQVEMKATQRLWDIFEKEDWQVFVSDMTFREINDYQNSENHRYVLEQLNRLNYTILEINKKVEKLAKKYIKKKTLTKEDKRDALHIACATYYGCDAIISWNFKQVNNPWKLKDINAINLRRRYGTMAVYTATALLELLEETAWNQEP